MQSTNSRKLLILLIAVVICTLEGASYIGLWLMARVTGVRAPRISTVLADQTKRVNDYLEGRHGRDEIDSLLGWHYRAGYARGGDVINAQQLRSLRVYSQAPRPAVLRTAVFGDSFVYGSEVDTKDAWPSIAEGTASDLEVLNYGVGGYGDDQAYLRFAREGLALSPSVVVLGFTPDDLRRLTNVYRRFIDDREFAWTKPRFLLASDGRLKYLPPPIGDTTGLASLAVHPEMAIHFGDHDQWYASVQYRDPLYDYSATVRLLTVLGVRFYNRFLDRNRLLAGGEFNPASEAFRLQLAISSKFAKEAERLGKLPLLLMLPDRYSIEQARSGRRTPYAGLVDSLRARGLDVIDPMSDFIALGRQANVASWFASGGHYSPQGNGIVGRAVGRQIRKAASRQLAARGSPK
jgi:hypothetical protein